MIGVLGRRPRRRYRSFYFLITGLVLSYFVLLSLMLISREFDQITLPNGLILARTSVFSGDDNVLLLKDNGESVYDTGVEFICFNENYIEATIKKPRKNHSYIYIVDEDKLVFSSNKDFYQVLEDSGLSSRDGCNGYFKTLVGVGMLLDQPWILKGRNYFNERNRG